jgi:hypothetical protein
MFGSMTDLDAFLQPETYQAIPGVLQKVHRDAAATGAFRKLCEQPFDDPQEHAVLSTSLVGSAEDRVRFA